jgi:hypothetical protein
MFSYFICTSLIKLQHTLLATMTTFAEQPPQLSPFAVALRLMLKTWRLPSQYMTPASAARRAVPALHPALLATLPAAPEIDDLTCQLIPGFGPRYFQGVSRLSINPVLKMGAVCKDGCEIVGGETELAEFHVPLPLQGGLKPTPYTVEVYLDAAATYMAQTVIVGLLRESAIPGTSQWPDDDNGPVPCPGRVELLPLVTTSAGMVEAGRN